MGEPTDIMNDAFKDLKNGEWVDELTVEYYHKIHDGFFVTADEKAIGFEQMGDVMVVSIYDLDDDGRAKERERGSVVIDDWTAEKLTSLVSLAMESHERIKESVNDRHPAEGNNTDYLG